MDIPKFFVGQKVVYKTGINMPKGTTGIVLDIKKSWCKCSKFEIKFSTKDSEIDNEECILVRCSLCKCYNFKEAVNEGYWNENSFDPIQEQKAKIMSFEKIKEEEKEEVLIMN